MKSDKLQFFEQVVEDLQDVGPELRGTCPSCGQPTLRLTIHGEDQFEPSCRNCSAGAIRDAVRAELIARKAPKNGAGPPDPAPATVARDANGWEAPLPLFAVVLPAFPIAALPPVLAEMVEATAEATQTPPDLAAMLCLAVLAAALQKRVEAVVRDGWREVVSLWTVSALPPGERKSPAFDPIVGPLIEYETELIRLMETEIAAAQTEYEIAEGALKRAKDHAVKAKTEFDRKELTRDASRLAADFEQLKVPKSPRLIADDATPERLGMLLSEQGGRMAVLSPEGDVFDMMAGRYSNGTANIGLYLRGHSGDDLIVDRVGRPAIVVRRAAISFGLTVQPDTLLGLTSNATFKGRGLLGRFLYALPRSRLGERDIRPRPLPDEVRFNYARMLTRCLNCPADITADGTPHPHGLRFSPAADDAVADLERWIEPQLAMGGALGSMAGWSGKLAGQVVRIAALLHCAESAESPWQRPVEDRSVERGRLIGNYLIPHARAAFQAMGTDPAINGAREVLEWLKRNRPASFSKRDAFNGLRASFARAADLDQPLVVLMEHGYIRQEAEERKRGAGRPPSPSFAVHPSLCSA